MSNKNVNQYSLLTDIATGDFFYLWDTSAGLSYKVYVNDINNLPGIRFNNHFQDILVDRKAYLSGIIGGATGTNLLSGLHPGILAGAGNRAVSNQSAILCGDTNLTSGNSSLAAGEDNQVFGYLAVCLGGQLHFLEPEGASILGGFSHFINGAQATNCSAIGGNTNIITGNSFDSVILGGASHRLMGSRSVILGGNNHIISGGDNSSILGGANGLASGNFSVVCGNKAKAFHNGATIFTDSTSNVNKLSYGPDSFTINYSGATWITGGGVNARQGFNLYPTGVTPTASIGGRSGDFAYKDDYLYVFTGDNADLSNKNWGRIQLSTLNNTPPSLVSNDSSIVHGRSDSYVLTNVFGTVTFGVNSPIVSLPAGNNTFEIECVFGAHKGSSSAAFIYYYLYNTSDNRMIPNTSGSRSLTAAYNQPTTQFISKTITGTNYAAAKNIQLYAMTDVNGDDARIISTGSWISYVKLA